MVEHCFACDKRINNPNDSRHSPAVAWTSDGQRVYVGRECIKSVAYWNERGGWQPPKGGPKAIPPTPPTPATHQTRRIESKSNLTPTPLMRSGQFDSV